MTDAHAELDEYTICHPVVDGELLLIRKQRGVGAGNLVGPGGAVEAGETPRECVVREVREEVRVDPLDVRKVGEFAFHFRDRDPDDDSMFAHAFRADGIDGDPQSTPEAVPEWHPVADPPYEEMWVDDRVWLPHLLDDRRFRATFVLTDDGDAMHEYEVELGVSFDD
ncbi:8-oxo-dGTP diphosphatase [Halobaculum sp. MBLA0147]|uniref:8-oxo-dGTP diphosphatase n=1 Tax=Halobaculum sp. MBLA0147 TaxID=3079934 RepID=UPI0035251BA4